MASKKCTKCNWFKILREPENGKAGVAICDKYNMILSYERSEQIEPLLCSDRNNAQKDSIS